MQDPIGSHLVSRITLRQGSRVKTTHIPLRDVCALRTKVSTIIDMEQPIRGVPYPYTRSKSIILEKLQSKIQGLSPMGLFEEQIPLHFTHCV